MSDTDFEGIKLRARYEHFKSTPEQRKTYVTLGLFALRGDLVFVAYYDEYAEGTVHFRELNEFYESVNKADGNTVKRFNLIEEDVISTEARDELWEKVDEIIYTQ